MRNDARALLAPFGVPPHAMSNSYLARVTSVEDPQSLARVKVEPYNFDGDRDVEIWARVAVPFAGGSRGAFFIPSVGDEVLIVFVNGDSRAPVVVGSLWNGADQPPETISTSVDRWTITGKFGTRIAIVEESEATATIECSTPAGVTLTMTDEAGGKVEVVCAGNTITIDSQGVKIESAAKIALQASQVEVTAGQVTVNSAFSQFSGVVQCNTLIATSVVSAAYTPGAGNIW